MSAEAGTVGRFRFLEWIGQSTMRIFEEVGHFFYILYTTNTQFMIMPNRIIIKDLTLPVGTRAEGSWVFKYWTTTCIERLFISEGCILCGISKFEFLGRGCYTDESVV